MTIPLCMGWSLRQAAPNWVSNQESLADFEHRQTVQLSGYRQAVGMGLPAVAGCQVPSASGFLRGKHFLHLAADVRMR